MPVEPLVEVLLEVAGVRELVPDAAAAALALAAAAPPAAADELDEDALAANTAVTRANETIIAEPIPIIFFIMPYYIPFQWFCQYPKK